jgi:inner membrane protein
MLPDADLLVGAHSGPTHGVGSALLVAVIVWVWLASHRRPRREVSLRLAVACGLAYASHILLDWLGTDTSAPIGIMALWPFSRNYYQSGLQLFMAVSRRYWRPGLFWWPNFLALIRELLILVPVLVIIQRVRRRD